MKKRFLLYLLFLWVLMLVNVEIISAELVCGQQPNSLIGYGQVQLFPGVNYSCDNFPDTYPLGYPGGFCPEDYETFSNSAIFGNCSRCHDPDCTGNITGRVLSASGVPIARATVKALPIRYNLSAPSLEKSTLTDASGVFELSGVTTGTYYFSASQEGYDTQLIEATINRHKVTTGLQFNLANGTCFEDCTNSYGRCNAQCNGLNFSNGICTFFSNLTLKVDVLCDNRIKGTEIIIPGTANGTHAMFVSCCEGSPYWKYYATAAVSTSNIKNLAKIEKLVKYNDQPVKLVLAYWPELE
ncbi:TPA: carboxypeptidase regulatory-like domain-containing protein [bacterium]|nr:carboxypeptidase regulatory-like domain-containing protein [bacterium]